MSSPCQWLPRALFSALLLLPLALPAAPDAASARPLVVATRVVPPFVVREQDGTLGGISIALWRSVAGELGLEYRLEEMGLKEMLDGVSEGRVDAAAAALTITAEREIRMDFSHPFLSSGLGIAVASNPELGLLSVGERLISSDFFKVVGGLFALLSAMGLLVWLLERRRNQQFGGSPAQGIGSGLWWSAVTMTTVGYGDKTPQTVGGRAVAVVWMFSSVILISSFTAAIATALTVGALDGKVHGPEDLARARVVSVANSTSAAYLEQRKLAFDSVPNLTAALERLLDDRADAVVYDAPILRYLALRDYPGRIEVLPGNFERQDYGIALPPGNPLREPINRALLRTLQSPDWEDLLDHYLGDLR